MVSPNRSAPIVSAVLWFVVIAAFFVPAGQSHAEEPSGATQQGAAHAPADDVRLQGTGRTASRKFDLAAGLAIFEVQHDGQANLVVRLLDDNGTVVETIFNQRGAFTGDRSAGVKRAGRYLLDIEADGPWSVNIFQPQPSRGESLPVSLQGTGYHATQFVHLNKGMTEFQITHNGKEQFRVTLFDRQGRQIDGLADELGAFEGSKSVNIAEAGIYLLNVAGDGDWTIDVQ